MRCAQCGGENPSGFAFCGGCGAPLVLICARCGFQTQPSFAFCGKCGAPLPVAADILTPEERDHLRTYLPPQLIDTLPFDVRTWPTPLLEQCIAHLSALIETIYTLLPSYLLEDLVRDPAPGRPSGRFVQGSLLFADISGFTALSELLSGSGREGAEEITALVNRCFSTMLAILRDHDGQLIRFGGDALLGLFPGPDGTTLAVQAAMRMQASMAEFAQTKTSQGTIPLSLKVAVRQGRFFAASLGSARHMEYALFGADMNATAAAEAAALPNQVVIDQATFDAIAVPCRVAPTASNYRIVEEIEPARHTTPGGIDAVPFFQRTPADLRRAVELLDALAPYLPAGLLPRLSSDPRALSVEGEHRLAAVLFANVHGLGVLADRLGPGQEAAISATLNQYFALMTEAVERFGGVINKIDLAEHGDKLVVFFGAPHAHEDDAERAVRAGLAMQAALERVRCTLPERAGLPDLCLDQQIGINYGYVFAGYVGTRWRHEYTVMGDEVNLAARLMAVAAPGSVTISSAVRRRVKALFDLVPRGEVRLKGKRDPVPIFAVTGQRAIPEPLRGLEGSPAPLVGRQAEWDLLLAAGAQLVQGRGQIVLLTGEAGIGKSRLAAELRAHLAAQPESAVRWVEGHCLSYTESVSYWPFLELVRQLVGIDAQDGEPEAGNKLRAALEQQLPLAEAGAHLPYLANFLSLPLEDDAQAKLRYLDAQALQQRTFVAVGALIEACVKRAGALIVALDDIHWMDQASLALLEHLLPLASRLPLLLLLLYRTDPARSHWRIHEKALRELAPWTSAVALRQLTADESDQLLVNLVRLDRWPAGFRERLIQRADGNPLYIEELIRVLIDDQVLRQDARNVWQVSGDLTAMQVPKTLEGVLMARLDRLDEPSRRVAQIASVVGRTFAFDLLDTICGERRTTLTQCLVELQRQDLVHETQRAPELVYSFKHVIIQEVCYQSLLGQVRRRYHREIAAALEASQDEGVEIERSAALIAHHAFAGHDWPRALRYHLLAGRQALRLYANQAAIDHYTRALESVGHHSPDAMGQHYQEIHAALGELLTTTGQYEPALGHLAEALRRAAERGDQDAQAHTCRWSARLHELRGEYPAALDWIQRGLDALAGRETAEAAQLLLIAGLIAVRQGDQQRANECCQNALRIAQDLDEVTVLARAYNLLGVMRSTRGNSATAIEDFQQALALYQYAGDIHGQALAQNGIANACFALGRWQEASSYYDRAREGFDQIGDVYHRALTDNNLGGIALNQGRLDEALRYYQDALHTLGQIGGSVWLVGLLHNNLGATYVRRGEVVPAHQHLRTSQQYFEQAQAREFLPELHRHYATAALLAADLDEAEADGRRALELARELATRGEEGCSLRVLGQVAAARGQLDLAEAHLSESCAILAEVGDIYEEARSVLALARLAQAQGRTADGLVLLDRCMVVFERLEAGLDLEAARVLCAEMVREE